jgi:hypothetical protein
MSQIVLLCILVFGAQTSSLIDSNSKDPGADSSESYSSNSVSSSNTESRSESVEEEALKEKDWANPKCAEGKFKKGLKCRPCSLCGSDLYIRKACSKDKDTFCEWCLTPNPLKNRDFREKCTNFIKINSDFQKALEQKNDEESQIQVQPVYLHHELLGHYRYPQISIHSWNSWKLEIILEYCFYLALIVLIFVIIRLLTKSKPYYRTVTINPPVFDESDNKNIIQAAEHIREKLGKRGYDRLEEFI